jgi:hypothetical protein
MCYGINVEIVDISDMVGQTFTEAYITKDYSEVYFKNDTVTYMMYHEQDCCESVSVEDIVGTLDMLIDTPIVKAYSSGDSGYSDIGTCTYTFYHIATIKGYVTIRWYGESNGYYSEEVDICKTIHNNY